MTWLGKWGFRHIDAAIVILFSGGERATTLPTDPSTFFWMGYGFGGCLVPSQEVFGSNMFRGSTSLCWRWDRQNKNRAFPHENHTVRIFFPMIHTLPVVPARGGAEVALKIYIYIRLFSSIELACAVRQPSPCVRALCESGVLFHMSHLKLHFALHTSHCTLHTPHFTLHTPHFSLHTALFPIHTSHFTARFPLHTPHFTLHTPHFTLHTPHFTLHSSRPTLHTALFTLRTSSHLSSSHLIPAHLFSSHLFSYVT